MSGVLWKVLWLIVGAAGYLGLMSLLGYILSEKWHPDRGDRRE